MFDVLGVISFLFVIYCIIMIIASVFSRKINRRLWVAVMFAGLVIFFTSYALDTKFDKDEPTEIDFSDVVIDTPEPSPTPTPAPTPVQTPETDLADESPAPVSPESSSEESSPQPEAESDEITAPEDTPDITAEGE